MAFPISTTTQCPASQTYPSPASLPLSSRTAAISACLVAVSRYPAPLRPLQSLSQGGASTPRKDNGYESSPRPSGVRMGLGLTKWRRKVSCCCSSYGWTHRTILPMVAKSGDHVTNTAGSSSQDCRVHMNSDCSLSRQQKFAWMVELLRLYFGELEVTCSKLLA
ncbi:hypothetical protein U9M48_001945 [Paspalum notatum var. saurae]|uniref:Uncharacterized protein n=1 Tax=Paspalum notatum var. saurae TaxID=547442 RepID=A0AAQ3PMY5_PASNO